MDRRCPSLLHAGKPTPRATRSAVSPSGATDGHPRWLEGWNKPLPADGSDRRGSSTWILDVDHRCPPRHHDGVLDPSLRCPSGARQSPGGGADGDCGTLDMSLRREWSTWILDIVPDSTPASRLLEQPVPQSPLRGRLTGTRGGWKAGTNHSRPMEVIDVDPRSGSSMSSHPHDGVLDPSLQCPLGARQSPGGAADGDCGTLDMSLRREWSTWIVDVLLSCTTQSQYHQRYCNPSGASESFGVHARCATRQSYDELHR